MVLYVEYNKQIISFEVIYRKRKTMGIRIEPPNKVVVISPLDISEERIKLIIQKKGNWILNKLKEQEEMFIAAIPEVPNTGDRLLYLGVYYNLKIIDRGISPKVYLYNEYIVVETNNRDNIKEVIKNWYKEEAKIIIRDRVAYFQRNFIIVPKDIKIKDQKTRWGSCTSKNDLLFNYRCVMLPYNQLDYIVVHEMCHMVEKNHKKVFWNLVQTVLPDYKEAMEGLKKVRII